MWSYPRKWIGLIAPSDIGGLVLASMKGIPESAVISGGFSTMGQASSNARFQGRQGLRIRKTKGMWNTSVTFYYSD